MFKGRQEIREAYRNQAVAADYIDTRFREPLGALLHARQIACVREAIERIRPTSVLELAPGPARLTTDLVSHLPTQTVLLDGSDQMLEVAGQRLRAVSSRSWTRVRGDAFKLPFSPHFDLVYTFRLIRHFEREDRCALYREIAKVLRPRGGLIFDAINAAVYSRLPVDVEARKYFDAALTEDELRTELEQCGFTDVVLMPVQRRFPVLRRVQILVAPRSRALARSAMEIVDRSGGQPLEWVVVCRRP